MLCQTVLDYPWNKDQNPNGTRIVFTAKTGGLFSRKVGAPSCWQAVASRAQGLAAIWAGNNRSRCLHLNIISWHHAYCRCWW